MTDKKINISITGEEGTSKATVLQYIVNALHSNSISYAVYDKDSPPIVQTFPLPHPFGQVELFVSNSINYNWMEEALQSASQCWCDEETSSTQMDTALATAFAKRLAFWMQAAAQNQCNTEFYRDLIDRCGVVIGDRAYISDDGSRRQNVLALKVVEIIEADYKTDYEST